MLLHVGWFRVMTAQSQNKIEPKIDSLKHSVKINETFNKLMRLLTYFRNLTTYKMPPCHSWFINSFYCPSFGENKVSLLIKGSVLNRTGYDNLWPYKYKNAANLINNKLSYSILINSTVPKLKSVLRLTDKITNFRYQILVNKHYRKPALRTQNDELLHKKFLELIFLSGYNQRPCVCKVFGYNECSVIWCLFVEIMK